MMENNALLDCREKFLAFQEVKGHLTPIDRFHGVQKCNGCGDELRTGDEAFCVTPVFYGTQCGCAEKLLEVAHG
jgi:hypothetical protein